MSVDELNNLQNEIQKRLDDLGVSSIAHIETIVANSNTNNASLKFTYDTSNIIAETTFWQSNTMYLHILDVNSGTNLFLYNDYYNDISEILDNLDNFFAILTKLI